MWGLALGLSSCLGGCFFSGYVGGGWSKKLGFGRPCCSKLMRPLPQQMPTTGATHGVVLLDSSHCKYKGAMVTNVVFVLLW